VCMQQALLWGLQLIREVRSLDFDLERTWDFRRKVVGMLAAVWSENLLRAVVAGRRSNLAAAVSSLVTAYRFAFGGN